MSQEKSFKDESAVKSSLSSDFEIRKQKVKELSRLAIDSWPELNKNSHCIFQIIEENQNGLQKETEYMFSGRLVSRREHGKSSFAILKDMTGEIQIYLKKDSLVNDFDLFSKLVDIGDFLWIKGFCFFTKTNHLTIKVSELKLQSKCLRPLAEKYHGLADQEQRYRQRYLDLISNSSSVSVLRKGL